ncbi:MAG: MFS transporter [Mesorhizobium sp.]
MSLPPLTPQQLVKPPRFELRLGLIFAAIFLPMGLHLPYFPLWLEYCGFSAPEIAVILAGPMFLRVVTTPAILTLADRAGDRADVLVALGATSLALSAGYFLAPTYGIVLGVSLLLSVVWSPHVALTDSVALSGVRRFGSDYSMMRIWGSVAYLSANFFGGLILAAAGEAIIPVLLSLSFAAVLAAAFLMPRLGPPRHASPLSTADLPDAVPSLMHPYFLAFVGSVGLTTASHAYLYAFSSIYWKSLGISDATVGLLWTVAVVGEVGVFMSFTRLFGRQSAATTLVIAAVSSIVRWLAFPLVEPAGLGTAGFVAVQLLHALSTGLMLIGLQKMIGETVGEARTGAAQGVAYFATNFGLALATLLSGPLYEATGVDGFFAMAVLAAGGLALALYARRSAPESRLRG